MTTVSGWWFGPANDKLPHGDGRLAEVGTTHEITGELVPCENALHMTKRVIDALPNATGLILWRVEGSGKIIKKESGILACQSRKYLARCNATRTVLAWARRCASDVAHLWGPPKVVRHFLETGDDAESALSTAFSAACKALNDTERLAAPPSSREATREVARSAALSAARSVVSILGCTLRAANVATDAATAMALAAVLEAPREAEYATTYAAAYEKYAIWLEEDCTALVKGYTPCAPLPTRLRPCSSTANPLT